MRTQEYENMENEKTDTWEHMNIEMGVRENWKTGKRKYIKYDDTNIKNMYIMYILC